jgi:phenylpropionate dioxygenase-like ring-hydroxylating dioxygenase large terminal subunit
VRAASRAKRKLILRLIDFPNFSGHWTPLTTGSNVEVGKPYADQVDGVPIVLFRDNTNRVKALIDRCPHRSVKLSIGKVTEGSLQCAFHGWRYDGSGACTRIPLNPDAKLSAVFAQALAVEERAGVVWIYAGDAAAAPPLILPEPLDEAGWFGSITQRDWPVHWSRSIQTMLDVAHIPFVHPQSIGVAFGRALGKNPNAFLDHTLEIREDGGFDFSWRVAATANDTSSDRGWLKFYPPHGMSLGIPQKDVRKRSILFIWCVPLTTDSSRM